MQHIGLFFGSFNPVHVGHMIIANYMVENTDMDGIWMVLSPQNPFKKRSTLAHDFDRLHLLNLAIGDHEFIESSDVEFALPKPSYTIDTLTYLKERNTTKKFSLIMGGDNLASLHKWKNYEQIIDNHDIYIYKRGEHTNPLLEGNPKIHMMEAPLLNISASYIRNEIKHNRSIQYLVTESVYEYLKKSMLYQ